MITERDKKTLLKVADFIEKLPQEKFHMGKYRCNKNHNWLRNNSGSFQYEFDRNNCGTVGCILGWCPFIEGLEPMLSDYEKMRGFPFWERYSDRIFDFTTQDDIWDYLFHSDWELVDDTPIGAAKRLRYIVEFGLPETWETELKGDSLLSYEKED